MKGSIRQITVSGGDSWVNTGDEAILTATLHLFREINPNILIRIVSGNGNKTETQFPDYEVVDRRNIFRFIKAIRKTDLYVWGGGHLIQNTSSKLFLIYHYFLLSLVIVHRVNLVGFCLGVEPINGKFWRRVTRLILNKFSFISVRDENSKKILDELQVATPIFVSSDPAVILSPDKDLNPELQELQYQPYVVLSPRKWFDYHSSLFPVKFYRQFSSADNERYLQTINVFGKVCDWIVDNLGFRIIFIPMYIENEQSDDFVATKIVEQMKRKEMTHIVKKQYPPQQLINFIQGAQFLIGMRMHSTILGACARVPIVGLYYQKKGESFFSALNLEDYSIPVEDFSLERMIRIIETIGPKKDSLIKEINTNMGSLKIKIKKNMDILSKEILNYDEKL